MKRILNRIHIVIIVSIVVVGSNCILEALGNQTNNDVADFMSNFNLDEFTDSFYSDKNGLTRIHCKNDLYNRSVNFFDDNIKPGWPVELDNHHGSSWDFDSSITYADLDQNGDFEVLIHSGEGVTNGKLYVFHHDGSSMDGWPIYTGSQGISTPAVGDIDPDYPGLEVVVAMNGLYSFWFVYAWHNDGTPVDGWPISAGQSFCSPSIADIDNDGFLEIILLIDNPGGDEWRDCKLYVWNGDGTNVSGFPITFESPEQSICGTSTAIGDINNDGNLEIVFGLWNKKMYAYQNDGTIFPGWPVLINNSETMGINAPPVLGDMDNDGDLEIICTSVGDYGNVHVLHHDGSYMGGWPKTVAWISDQSPSLCDIDKDYDLEIVLSYGVGSSTHDKMIIWHHNGNVFNGWPQDDSSPIRGQSVIGDIDGDLDFELFSNGRNIFGWHHNGELLQNFPKGDLGRFDGAVAIADLENNGKMDLISGAYAWEFTDEYEIFNVEWPMFQHDAQHTGLYHSTEDDEEPPMLGMIKPENALYIRNKKIMSLRKPLIIGSIDIQVNATDVQSGIREVEFYIDNELKATVMSEPYK